MCRQDAGNVMPAPEVIGVRAACIRVAVTASRPPGRPDLSALHRMLSDTAIAPGGRNL